MRLVLVLAMATFGLAATAAEAAAAPVNNPLSLELVGTCSDGSYMTRFRPPADMRLSTRSRTACKSPSSCP
jgi:hypothetical protein